MLNYVIWNLKPQILDLGFFQLRYYTLLFILGFIVGYIFMARFFKREGIKHELLDKLTIYVILSTIIGARLGHCLFYEFDRYIHNPLEMILPFSWDSEEGFKIVGYQGLASHGGAIGLLIGLYLFSRKTKLAYLGILDKIAIVTAFAAFCIRTGNLMNSEIYGMPTNNRTGFIYTHDFNHYASNDYVENIKYKKLQPDSISSKIDSLVHIEAQITFSRRVRDENYVQNLAEMSLKNLLANTHYQNNITHPDVSNLEYKIEQYKRHYILKAKVYGVPRHPSQIYEALAYLLIFLLLLLIYNKKGTQLKNGMYLGWFLVLVFTARFFIEFLKENQENFENALPINMGQILSIPFIIFGILLLVLPLTIKNNKTVTQ